MAPEALYSPPLTLTPALLNRVAAIAEALGRWSARQERHLSPRLRRDNRIQAIQASLAIEQNTLSFEQVTALFDGKRVVGQPVTFRRFARPSLPTRLPIAGSRPIGSICWKPTAC